MTVASSDQEAISALIDNPPAPAQIADQWVESGCGITLHDTEIAVEDGRVVLSDGTAVNVGDVRYTLASTTSTNYIFLINRSGDMKIGANTDDSNPADPFVKIGEVDPSAETVTEVNDGDPPLTGSSVSASSGTISGTAEVLRDTAGSVVFQSAGSASATLTTSGSATATTGTTLDGNYTQVQLTVTGTITTASVVAKLNGSAVATLTAAGTTTVSSTTAVTSPTWTLSAGLTAGSGLTAGLSPSINSTTTINAN